MSGARFELPSGIRLRIAASLSLRPRTLGELSQMNGITIQGILKHLKALEAQGLASESKVGGRSMKVRKVYTSGGVELGDFSSGGLLVVKARKSGGESLRPPRENLETLAEEVLLQRRRVREQTRRLERSIDELVSDQRALRKAVGALRAEDDEKLILQVLFSEESLAEGTEALVRHFGLRDGRRSIDKALSKARHNVK